MIRRRFLSDLHLEDENHPHFRTFKSVLQTISTEVDEIVILGDLTEMWIGDDDDSPFADALREALRSASDSCQVHLMHGNRDFLIGEEFARDTGVVLLEDPHVTDDGLLLSHGDALCTQDTAYMELRTMLRSPQWQADVLGRSLEERFDLGRMMREQSRSAGSNKPTNITDVTGSEVDKLATSMGVSTMIHGHTHRPGIHRHSWGKRFVLGAWERCSWQIEQKGTELNLLCLPLVNG
jgi:UDP-2,3-diacylglucosamine hydrolase